MSNTTWKQVERRVAKVLDGKRVGPTGRQGPDVVSDWLVVEVKHRSRLPAWLKDALQQAKRAARDDQLPIAVLHEKGMRGGIVCMSLADFRDWFGGGEVAQNGSE